MEKLTKDDILKYFEEMNNRLVKENQYGEIVMAGGAALTLVFNARFATRDIDALFRPAEDLRKIIKSMADDYNLPHDWLNDGVKGFMNDKMQFDEVLSHSNLSIYAVNAEGLLAMKLASARPNTEDMGDSVFLMKVLKIKEEKQLFEILDKYIMPNQLTMASKYFTMEAFERYQNEIENEPPPNKPKHNPETHTDITTDTEQTQNTNNQTNTNNPPTQNHNGTSQSGFFNAQNQNNRNNHNNGNNHNNHNNGNKITKRHQKNNYMESCK